jgi:dTDP-4-dehydrorhamnose reductase
MKVLVLGHKGMLGHMVVKYLIHKGIKVITTNTRWPESPFKLGMRLDYVINCIGAIPQRTDNFDVNWQLPIWLDLHSPCKVIHPGTDYEEGDGYSLSKKIASNYICNLGKQTKIIKTSIIGPELKTKNSLLEWFLFQQKSAEGYTESMWNGITTLEWSKQCLFLMNNWGDQNTLNILGSKIISKYNLLKVIKKVFKKDIIITPKKMGIDKSIKIDIKMKNIETQLLDLKKFYYDN